MHNKITGLTQNFMITKVFLVFSKPRRWKVLVTQLSIQASHRDTLRKVEDTDTGVLMLRKCLGSPVRSVYHSKLCKDGLPFSYPEILYVWIYVKCSHSYV